jgi:cytochrome b6-f complex iron-sulfur subunit
LRVADQNVSAILTRFMKRRHLLNTLLSSGIAATAASIIYPILRFIIPPEAAESAVMSVSAGRPDDVPPNTGMIFKFGAEPGLLIRTTEGELKAFSARCTHLNCTVQYDPAQKLIVCACHNGQFDLNGKNVAGPPPKPLPALNVNVRGDEVIVSKV